MRAPLKRRDILKLVGGSALGFFLTPVPWKLLDDSAIWTQNWPLTPALPRGELSERVSACTLCGGGCGVRASCVAGVPYALAGRAGHPVSRGYLCAAGLAGHHLAAHPLRITSPARFIGKGAGARLEEVSIEEAMAEVASKLTAATGGVAFLDGQPGRAVSARYQKFIAGVVGGSYLVGPSREDATLAALASMLDPPARPLGFDFERAAMVLSFGAPLLEGWGSPGRFSGKRSFTLVQAESRQSRTALNAEEWIALAPGSEYYFAMALANVILSEELHDRAVESTVSDLETYRQIVSAYTPEWTDTRTGIAPAVTRRLAAELAAARGAIVLGGCDPGGGPMDRSAEYAIAGLNILLGGVGKPGGIVYRNSMPVNGTEGAPARDVRDVPDGSLRLLIVDGAPSGYAVPWELIKRKLRPGEGIVVSYSSAWNEIAARADIVVPACAPYEVLQDVASPAGAQTCSLGMAITLLAPRPFALDPAAFAARLAGAAGLPPGAASSEELLKERVRAIAAERRGAVVTQDGGEKRVDACAGAEELWADLMEGGVWMDDPASQGAPKGATMASAMLRPPHTGAPSANALVLMPYGWKGAVSAAEASPLMSKIFQESSLRDLPGTIRMNPETASSLGLEGGAAVLLMTAMGTMPARLRTDQGVRPGVVLAPVAPAPGGTPGARGPDQRVLDLCDVREDGTWRMTRASVRKA